MVGLGTMGAGIAQVSAQAGFETVGREVTDDLCERARGTIEHYLGRGVEKGKLTAEERDAALGRLTLTTDLGDLAGCDLVIEAIVEELEPKRETFAALERVVGPDAILASNTSAIPIAKIAEAAENPERVIALSRSSGVMPSSSSLMHSLSVGTRMRLTMKPGVSFARTGCLPACSAHS